VIDTSYAAQKAALLRRKLFKKLTYVYRVGG